MIIPQLDREQAKECISCGHSSFLGAEKHARLLIEKLKEVCFEIEKAVDAGMEQDQNEAPAMAAEAWELHGKANGLLKEIHRYHSNTVATIRKCGLEVPVELGGGGR